MSRNPSDLVFGWVKENKYVDSIALAGAYARYEQKPDSDMDLVMVVHSRAVFIDTLEWLNAFGRVVKYSPDDCGRVRTVRYFMRTVWGLNLER